MFHERILWAQIENVVLHDPGGDDHDGLRMHRRGRRGILDDLGQRRPMDDPPGSDRERVTGNEGLCANRWLSGEKPLQILEREACTAYEIAPAALQRRIQDLWIGHRKIGGSNEIEGLPAHE